MARNIYLAPYDVVNLEAPGLIHHLVLARYLKHEMAAQRERKYSVRDPEDV